MLAEKYRPQTFDDVIGQDKTIAAMRWYLDRPADSGLAFLLNGPSGSGKTTIAECAARYWGCTDFDIHRLESAQCDVQALRQVSNDMYIHGSHGRKMYLIDEVHTITGRAADRMLSLLESLPPHVLMVGTTTETDWTDGILLSRWVRFDLQKVRASDVSAYLERIAQAEGLPMPDDPKYFDKLVKYHGLNIRDQLNQLPARMLTGVAQAA